MSRKEDEATWGEAIVGALILALFVAAVRAVWLLPEMWL